MAVTLPGTYKCNNQLIPMRPYSCHSDISPDKFKNRIVVHSSGNVSWEDPLSSTCQYDKVTQDLRCTGCTHHKGL